MARSHFVTGSWFRLSFRSYFIRLVATPRPRRADRPPAGTTGQSEFPHLMRSQGAAAVRARRGAAAFLLVSGRIEDLQRGPPAGPELCDCLLGHRREPPVEPV